MCNCKATEMIAGIVILVFAIWPSAIVAATTSKWIVIISAAVLVIHSLGCKDLTCETSEMPSKSKAKKKKRK